MKVGELMKDQYGRWYWVPGFVFVAFVVTLLTLAIISCNSNLVEQPEAVVKPPHSIIILAGNATLTIYEIDGCQYVESYHGGITHLETCPNPMHRK